MPAVEEARRFTEAFRKARSRIRARQSLRHVLSGVGIGLTIGALLALGSWRLRQDGLRHLAPLAGLVGGALGWVVARRRTFADRDVALYLDAALGSGEAVATALELCGNTEARAKDTSHAVFVNAARKLESYAPPQRMPAMVRPGHGVIPAAAIALGFALAAKLPPPPAVVAPPGTDRVTLPAVKGLVKIAELGQIKARDDAQKKRLEQIASDAKKLQEQLKKGMPLRDAEAEVARLRDQIAAEKLGLGQGDEQRGLEAAIGRLAQDPRTEGAARALGDRDLARLDEEMENLAQSREMSDRARARQVIEEAAEAARQAGAPGVSHMLEQERDRLKHLEERALAKLTPEERQRLAEKLKKELERGGPPAGSLSRKDLEDLEKKLATKEGQKELEDELRRMAAEDGENGGSDESSRQHALGEAERGANEAEGELGGRPLPLPTDQGGKSDGKSAEGSASNDGPNGSGSGSGSGPGKPPAATAPPTPAIPNADGLVARANGRLLPGATLPGGAMGRIPGRAGARALTGASGTLGAAKADDLGGVERSSIPEEYREQVGRYFQP